MVREVMLRAACLGNLIPYLTASNEISKHMAVTRILLSNGSGAWCGDYLNSNSIVTDDGVDSEYFKALSLSVEVLEFLTNFSDWLHRHRETNLLVMNKFILFYLTFYTLCHIT